MVTTEQAGGSGSTMSDRNGILREHLGEEGLGAGARLLANEDESQAGGDERGEEERQEPLARASEGNDLAVGGVEGLGSLEFRPLRTCRV
jgi:hypothetical protein